MYIRLQCLTLLAFCCSSCSVGGLEEIAPAAEIYHIVPTEGPKSTELEIQGTLFGEDVSDHEVTLNGRILPITEVSPSLIKVTIPPGVGTGSVALKVNGERAFNQPVFNYEWTMELFAGSGNYGHQDGHVSEATFTYPWTITSDAQGNVFVCESPESLIRRISNTGWVTSMGKGESGYQDGPISQAMFGVIEGMYGDAEGNIFLADASNYCIRRISTEGMVSTYAGSGASGYEDGSLDEAKFGMIRGIWGDQNNNLFVADAGNYCVRKISPAGVVSTFAGNGVSGFKDGTAMQASFYGMTGIYGDNQGNLYVSERYSIRKISSEGGVSTMAGSLDPGSKDGKGNEAAFSFLRGLVADNQGFVYVADYGNKAIRRITPDGMVSTIISLGSEPVGIAIDSMGRLCIADYYNHRILQVD